MRPTTMDGAIRTEPELRARRSVPPRLVASFRDQLGRAVAESSGPPPPRPRTETAAPAAPSPMPRPPVPPPGADRGTIGTETPGPARAAILTRAEALLGVPYVWGGDSPRGLDCSSFVSRAWGVSRQTTDTLQRVADPIGRDELRPGDIMNLPTWKDPERYGHVRIFDRWANPEKTRVWVYEETSDTGMAVHRAIDYDPRYQPMRAKHLAAETT